MSVSLKAVRPHHLEMVSNQTSGAFQNGPRSYFYNMLQLLNPVSTFSDFFSAANSGTLAKDQSQHLIGHEI
jgi:hypothetical protein